MDPAVVEAIRSGAVPDFAKNDEQVCYDVSAALVSGRTLEDDLWARMLDSIGEDGVNEVLGLIGLCTSVCLTMVAYKLPTKNGEPDPLP